MTAQATRRQRTVATLPLFDRQLPIASRQAAVHQWQRRSPGWPTAGGFEASLTSCCSLMSSRRAGARLPLPALSSV